MEQKKIDELWHKTEVIKAQAILSHYLDEDAKRSFTKGEGNYDSVPYHPSVTDLNASLKTENIGKHDYYCVQCQQDLNTMMRHGLKVSALYLFDHYMKSKRIGPKQELDRLGYSENYRHLFDILLPKALLRFASPKQIPSNLFSYLFNVEQNRYNKSAQKSTH